MIELSEYQKEDIELLAEAVAGSLHLKPRAWVCRFGGISSITKLPEEFQHLISDYKETKAQMMKCV